MSGLVLKLVTPACLRHGSPPCLVPVVGHAGCGSLQGRGDWEGKRACSRCPLGWQVPGVPHTSEHLILHPEHAALHLTCTHSVLTISCFCLCGKFGLAFLVFFFYLHFDTGVWFFCSFGPFVCLVLVFFSVFGFFKNNTALVQIDILFYIWVEYESRYGSMTCSAEETLDSLLLPHCIWHPMRLG